MNKKNSNDEVKKNDATGQENHHSAEIPQQSREEILQKRKERKLQKREVKQLERDRIKYEEKLNKTSEKIRIISKQRFDECCTKLQNTPITAATTTTNQNQSSSFTTGPRKYKPRGKFHNVQKDFNLLDFVVEKKKVKNTLLLEKPLKVDKLSLTTIKLNRGKKREVPKKNFSRLRKIILKDRILRQQENTSNDNSQGNEIKSESNVAIIINVNKENCGTGDVEKIQNLKNCSENCRTEDADVGETPINKCNENHILKDEENSTLNFDKLEISDKNTKLNLTTTTSKINHSRKFRPYCDNTISKKLCNLTENLLRELFRFQKRAYEKNQIKACAHRRYVLGFNEVQRQLDIRKTKLIILAPDCENCNLPGGILDIINEIKLKCKNENIPYLFSLNRNRMGYILFKKVPVSCVGILSYDGAQDIFHSLIEEVTQEKKKYENLMKSEKLTS